MKFIGITQRVDIHPDYGERRDALDQKWLEFFIACDLTPLLLPNCLTLVKTYIKQLPISGIVLTGGNSPVLYGGDAPERDEVEAFLVSWALQSAKPLIGVCRGMQSIQMAFDHQLERVVGHVSKQMEIKLDDRNRIVNSYHNLATTCCHPPLSPWAQGQDGVIKAVKHNHADIYGIMWHPERNSPFDHQDIQLFKQVLNQ